LKGVHGKTTRQSERIKEKAKYWGNRNPVPGYAGTHAKKETVLARFIINIPSRRRKKEINRTWDKEEGREKSSPQESLLSIKGVSKKGRSKNGR